MCSYYFKVKFHPLIFPSQTENIILIYNNFIGNQPCVSGMFILSFLCVHENNIYNIIPVIIKSVIAAQGSSIDYVVSLL